MCIRDSSIGGDSDTVACITGGIAAAFYKEIPAEIREFTLNKLDADLRKTVFRIRKKNTKFQLETRNQQPEK